MPFAQLWPMTVILGHKEKIPLGILFHSLVPHELSLVCLTLALALLGSSARLGSERSAAEKELQIQL